MALTTDQAPINPPAIPVTPCDLMRAEISKYTDWNTHIMQAIAQAENRTCDPLRHNLTASETHRDATGSIICIGSYGVLQVGCLHYSESDNRDDLATNVKIAHRLWKHRQTWGNGYEAWTMYKNGEYKEFL